MEGAETALFSDEDHRRLRRALEVLPREQRETVVLRYFSDLTVPEVAAVMGQHEGTIKSCLSRALNSLGEILRKSVRGYMFEVIGMKPDARCPVIAV
jgi:RNA polymerase sigma-70 factor, ECF subfamily